MSSRSNRNGEIDLMRFMFCIFIIIYHYPLKFINIGVSGYFAVEFFFITSGVYFAKKMNAIQCSSKEIGFSFIISKILNYYKFYIPALILNLIYIVIYEWKGLHDFVYRLFISIPQFTFLDMLGFNVLRYDALIYVGASWYLSATILSYIILTPIISYSLKDFTTKIAPIIIVISISFLYKYYGKLTVLHDFSVGFIDGGLIRSIFEISLGCVCFEIGEKLKNKKSKNPKIMTLIEVVIITIVFFYMCGYHAPITELPMLLLLAVAIIIAYSEQSNLQLIRKCNIINYLGKLSFPLYVFHRIVSSFFEKLNIANHFIIYIVICILLSTTMMWVIKKKELITQHHLDYKQSR